MVVMFLVSVGLRRNAIFGRDVSGFSGSMK